MDIVKKILALSDKRIILISFILSFCIRMLFVFFFGFGTQQNLYENGVIAINLLEGRGYSYDAFGVGNQETCYMQPFYPYFIAGVFSIFGVNSITAIGIIQILQSFVDSITAIFIYILVKKYFSKFVALISTIIYICYPDFIYSGWTLHQLAFITFFVVSIVFYASILQQKPSYKNGIIWGIISGFSLLVEPILMAIILLTVFWLIIHWIFKNKTKRLFKKTNAFLEITSFSKVLKISVLMLSFTIITVSPWLTRNFLVTGHFVFIKDSGYNLWRGNNENYTQTGVPSNMTLDLINAANSTKEYEIDQYFSSLATGYILNHISDTINNCFKRIYWFVWFPDTLTEQSPTIRKVIYLPLLLLAICAIVVLRKRLIDSILFLLPIIGFLAVYSISFVLPRYRVPVEPILFIFSAISIEFFYEKIMTKDKSFLI